MLINPRVRTATEDEQIYWVDLPTRLAIGNPDDGFENVAEFKSEQEAIAFAKEHWGADDLGRISLVSPQPKDEQHSRLVAALRRSKLLFLQTAKPDDYIQDMITEIDVVLANEPESEER